MKIKLLLTTIILAILSIYPSIVMAQTVAVTGTITDTQSTPYSNGLLTVTFVNATGLQATFGGNPSFQKSYSVFLDTNGSFTVSLPPNSTASPSIQPSGTQWNFSYQSQGGYGAANINVTITGAGSISGTLSGLARITWPYGNIPPPGGSGQGIVFVSSTTLGWGTTGSGSVSGQANNVIPKGTTGTTITQQSSCTDNGTTFSCTEPIATTGSFSTGSGSTACGAGTTGCDAYVEGSVACTPVAGQACRRLDATLHNFAIELNGGIETPEPVFSVVPAGSKCLQSSGVAGLIVEATNACGGSAFPITVTGGVSGGIPYFSSTTVESASPILNTNIVTKGGGAGNPPTNSSMTDNGTSVTSSDTGGFIAPIFTSNGSTAGFVDYPQGSTSAAVAPCNVATSICRQAPAAVTSYVLNLAAAAPVNNNSAEVFSNANPGIGTFAKMPQTAITSGTAYTNATTTFSNVVGSAGQTLQLTVEANTNYVLTCQILWSASGATAGPKFQFTGPASPTAVQYSVVQAVTATTDGTAGATAFSTSLNASGATVVTGTNEPAELSLGLVNGANAGTVILQAAAQGAGTLTIQPGSYCQGQ